jgi:RNA polymerase sigma factor (sigma-70 family)
VKWILRREPFEIVSGRIFLPVFPLQDSLVTLSLHLEEVLMSDADDEPPLPGDHHTWRRIVEQGQLARFREGVIVGAIRANYRRKGVDQDFVREMIVVISDRMLEILRGEISATTFPNRGEDIVEAVHDAMLKALLSPTAADGEGLRKWFKSTLRNRAIDHVRKALKAMNLLPDMVDDPGGMVDWRTEHFSHAEQDVHVKRILNSIRDKDKRAAFELHMQGVPCGSKKGESISSILGISPDTASNRIAAVQRQLAKMIGKS